MDKRVATLRGLRGYSKDTEHIDNTLLHPKACYGGILNGTFVETKDPNAERFFIRRAKIADEDRQLADVSISHDGKYAMAVCIALDEAFHPDQEKPAIIDDGTGEPLHEPEWADEGWFSPRENEVEDADHNIQNTGHSNAVSEDSEVTT